MDFMKVGKYLVMVGALLTVLGLAWCLVLILEKAQAPYRDAEAVVQRVEQARMRGQYVEAWPDQTAQKNAMELMLDQWHLSLPSALLGFAMLTIGIAMRFASPKKLASDSETASQESSAR